MSTESSNTRRQRGLCIDCGHLAVPKLLQAGSMRVEIALWLSVAILMFLQPTTILLLIIPTIYSFWRLVYRRKVCNKCGSSNIIRSNSQLAIKIMQRLHYS